MNIWVIFGATLVGLVACAVALVLILLCAAGIAVLWDEFVVRGRDGTVGGERTRRHLQIQREHQLRRAQITRLRTRLRRAEKKLIDIAWRASPDIEDSCGCVFCDLALEVIEHDGKPMHQVEGGQSVMDGFKWVPCTREDKP